MVACLLTFYNYPAHPFLQLLKGDVAAFAWRSLIRCLSCFLHFCFNWSRQQVCLSDTKIYSSLYTIWGSSRWKKREVSPMSVPDLLNTMNLSINVVRDIQYFLSPIFKICFLLLKLIGGWKHATCIYTISFSLSFMNPSPLYKHTNVRNKLLPCALV